MKSSHSGREMTPNSTTYRSYMNTCLVFTEFVARLLIEKSFFQNENISQTSLLYLANDLIRTLHKTQPQKMSVAKELVITYKQITGKALTSEEQEYESSETEIDVVDEVLNGIRYSTLGLLGKSFFSSVINALKPGLWGHIPAIVGYTGAVLYGPQAIQSAVEQTLEYSRCNASQKEWLRSWLLTIGRLALGFIPKVHATETGVHYHYPSRTGHISTHGTHHAANMRGGDITYTRLGSLSTPEGEHAAEYLLQFKLHQVDRLTEQCIRIQVVNETGEKIPVAFNFVQGEYGPEIRVTSPDSLLASHWGSYFTNPSPMSSLQRQMQFGKEISLELINSGIRHIHYFGTTLLAANLWQSNKIPLMLGLLAINSLPSVSASAETKDFKKNCLMQMCTDSFEAGNYFHAKLICNEALKAGYDTAELHYTLGRIAKEFGQHTYAFKQFEAATHLDSTHYAAAAAYNNTHKMFNAYFENLSLVLNLTTHQDIAEMCDFVYPLRYHFFKKHDLYVPRPIEYMLICLAEIYVNSKSQFNSESQQMLAFHYERAKSFGWLKAEISYESSEDRTGSPYKGAAFIKNDTKRIIIAHRIPSDLLCEIFYHDVQIVHDTEFYIHLNVARSFVESVKKKYPGYYISHTGHLVGAAIAEAIACEFKSVAITVNSPGYLLSQKNNIACDAQIITYVAYQHFANTLSKHIGSMRHVDRGLNYFIDNFAIFCVKFHRSVPAKETIQKIFEDNFTRFFEVMTTLDPCLGYPPDSYHVGFWKNNPLERAKELRLERTWEFTPKDKELLGTRNINLDMLSNDFQRKWDNGRIGIEHFSKRARRFLRSYLDNGLYPNNINPKVLQLYYISDDNEIFVISDTHTETTIYTACDFQDYIEMKLYEATVNSFPRVKDTNYQRDMARISRHCNRFEETCDGDSQIKP
jgi:hypothetical protein